MIMNLYFVTLYYFIKPLGFNMSYPVHQTKTTASWSSVRMAMPRHTCRAGGRTRPFTSAALWRSAMASSFLSLANNHLADWGRTLTRDRESRQGKKKKWTGAEKLVKTVQIHSGSNIQMPTEFTPPYIEDEQEARGWYSQLQLSPVPYQVCYACKQYVAQTKCIVGNDTS